MAISKEKTSVKISIHKRSLDLIDKFASAMKMSKSEFIESVCVTFIGDVVKKQQQMRKANTQTKKGKA